MSGLWVPAALLLGAAVVLGLVIGIAASVGQWAAARVLRGRAPKRVSPARIRQARQYHAPVPASEYYHPVGPVLPPGGRVRGCGTDWPAP